MTKTTQQLIAEHEASLAALKAQLQKEEQKPKGRWEPTGGEKFYYLSSTGEAFVDVFHSLGQEPLDKEIAAQGLAFRTEQQAKDHARYRAIHKKLLDAAGDYKPDWGGINNKKWYVSYDNAGHNLYFSFWRTLSQVNIVYFPTEEAAKAAYDAIGLEDAKFYLTYSMQGI